VLSACLLFGTLSAPPARAFEPILMFLFGMAREVMYDAFLNSQKAPQPNSEPLPAVYPGTMVEPRKLRELIDESFYYLSERRREALFQAFNDELIKPKNATVRASMIQYFAEHAFAVRNVMDRLSKLTEPEMRALSEHFAAEARNLPVEDREKLRTVLEEGLLPVPPDLNRMLVVAVAEIPRPPPAEAVPVVQDGGASKGAAKAKPQARGRSEAQIAASALTVKPGDARYAVSPPAAGVEAVPGARVAAGREPRPEGVAVW